MPNTSPAKASPKPRLICGDHATSVVPDADRRTVQPLSRSRAATARTARNSVSGISPSADRPPIIQPSPAPIKTITPCTCPNKFEACKSAGVRMARFRSLAVIAIPLSPTVSECLFEPSKSSGNKLLTNRVIPCKITMSSATSVAPCR